MFGFFGVLEFVVVEIIGVVGIFWGIELGNWDFLIFFLGVGFILNEKKKLFNKIKDYFYREKVNFIELKEFYYYYYDEMERFMRIFSEKYSDIIKLYSIGFSV